MMPGQIVKRYDNSTDRRNPLLSLVLVELLGSVQPYEEENLDPEI